MRVHSGVRICQQQLRCITTIKWTIKSCVVPLLSGIYWEQSVVILSEIHKKKQLGCKSKCWQYRFSVNYERVATLLVFIVCLNVILWQLLWSCWLRLGQDHVWADPVLFPVTRIKCRQLMFLQTSDIWTFVIHTYNIYIPTVSHIVFTLHVYDLI